MANRHEIGRKYSQVLPSSYYFKPNTQIKPPNNFVDSYDKSRFLDNPYPDRKVIHKAKT